MSNIQKNFKMKSQLRHMADGGVVDHMSGKSREQQLKEATGHSIPAKAPGPGQPDFRNVRSSSQTTYGQKPKSALQRLFGMADGGKPPQPNTEYDFAQGHGGDIKGPGGPTDDKVGPVMLSNKEYVLPADTVDAIGVEKLDALRAATHDFEETENAAGMAGGGILDRAKDMFSSLRGKPAAPAAPAPAAPPPAAPAPFAQTPPPTNPSYRTPGGFQQTPTPTNPSFRPAATANAAPVAETAAAGSRAGSVLRGAAKQFTPIAATMGALGTLGDQGTGYRDEYNKQLGIENRGGVAATAGDAARVFENVGDTLTFGLAGKLGRGIGSAMGGGSFLDGATGPSQRERFAADAATPMAAPGGPGAPSTSLRTPVGGLPNMSGIPDSSPAVTGADPQSQYAQRGDDEIIGSFNGKPMTKGEADKRAGSLQTASFMPAQPERDPMMDMLQSALRGNGGGGGYSGPSSNAKEINARFDQLNKDLASRYSSKGAGNLSKRQLELEGLRAQALEGDARNMSSLRGQDMASGTAANRDRLQAAEIAAGLMKDRQSQAANTNKAAMDAQAKAEEMRMKGLEGQDKTMSGIMEEIRTRFKDDPTTMESMTMRLQSAGPEAIGRIAELHGQEKFTAIADLVKSGEIAQKFDAGQSGLWGTTDSGLPRVASERDEPEFFSDVINGGSGVGSALGREIKDTLGFDGGVIVDDNGRVAGRSGVYDDAYRARVAENAKKDRERRSSLRGN